MMGAGYSFRRIPSASFFSATSPLRRPSAFTKRSLAAVRRPRRSGMPPRDSAIRTLSCVRRESEAFLASASKPSAFRIESNAEEQYQRLLELGFKKAKRLAPNKHGLFPVVYGSYSTYSEAHEAMKNIQKLDNKDAWLLVDEL